jgi:putative ABC transport system permease protein
MFTLARRNLLSERVRLAVSVGGVAFAVLVIVLLRGVFVAYQSKVGEYYRGVGADLWVVQQGTPDFVHAFSLVRTLTGPTSLR